MNTIQPIRDRPTSERDAIRDEYMRRWMDASGVDISFAEVIAIRQEYRAEYEQTARKAIPGVVDGYRVFTDVNRTMRRLRANGILSAVISNADADVTDFCRRLDFAHEMDLIVTSAVVGFEKPDVRTYLAALEPLGIEPGRALHIGDQPRSDVVGALAVGMQAALIDRYERHQATDHQVPIFTNLDALVDHVLQVNEVPESHA
jgi:HAD superfamily hydrolase (TIGR01509 family)